MPILAKPITRAEYYASRYDKQKALDDKEKERIAKLSVEEKKKEENLKQTMSKAEEGKTAVDTQGRGYSVAPVVLKQQQEIRANRRTTFVDTQGRSFSQNPDVVVSKVETRPYQKTTLTYASGKTEEIQPLSNIYGTYVSQNEIDNSDSTREFFQDYSTYEKNAETKKKISESPYNPLMYVKRGANTVTVATGLGLRTIGDYGSLALTRDVLPTKTGTKVENVGKGYVKVLTATTGGYVGGSVLGGTIASYPAIKTVATSKTFIYSTSALTGVSFGYGFSKSEDKLLYTSEFIGGFAGGISGFKVGYAKYDPLNPNIKFSNPKIKYSESEVITRLKTNRLIETNKDYVSSKRVGLVEVTKETTPLEFKFTQRISGRATGQRSTFVYKDGSYGVIDRYSTPKIFGGRQQIVREYTPIEANNPKTLAFDYEAYSFKGRSNKINPLASGVVAYPKPLISFGKATYEPIDFQPKRGTYDVELKSVEVKGVEPSYKSSLKQQVTNINEAKSRADKYSYFEDVTKLRQSSGKGSFIYTRGVSNRISTSGYTRTVTNEPKLIVTKKNQYIGTSEVVEGQRNIPVYGDKVYIDKMIMNKGVLTQEKFPSQLSETVIKNRVRIYGNPLNQLSPSNMKVYSGNKYYAMNRPSTLSKLISSKRASLVSPLTQQVSNNRIQIPKPILRSPSVQSSLSNLYSPANVKTPVQAISPNIKQDSRKSISDFNTPNYKTVSVQLPSLALNNRSDVRQNNYTAIRIDNIIQNDREVRSRTETRAKSEVRQDVKQNLELKQELRQELKQDLRYKNNLKLQTPVRPPPFVPVKIVPPKWFIFPKFNTKTPRSTKRSNNKLNLNLKDSKKRLFILPSLKNVIIYEGTTGKEAIMPYRTRKVKSDFESQYYGKDIFGSPIPVFQKQRFKY